MKKLLFVINQMYKGGAETSLVNLLSQLDPQEYEIDLLVLNQAPVGNAVPILKYVPFYVNLCNSYGFYGDNSLYDRIKGKLLYKKVQKEKYFIKSLEFVRGKLYDWAFHVGEWHSPEFVAKEVDSKHKACWIHNDLSLAEYFLPEEYFKYFEYFEKYIFVSKNSFEESIKKYPFLKEKSTVIYNISNVERIASMAKEPVEDFKFSSEIPTLITCANFRTQKNHSRQVEVMKSLFNKGIKFNWINIGALTDEKIVAKVRKAVKAYGLDDFFYILGPKENPYKYISKCTAVMVLSDYESWSMVITEAKILGVPVISTATSGALEQIEDEKTGILADFSTDDISSKIENFLLSQSLRDEIKDKLRNFDNTDDVVSSFKNLTDSENDVERESDNKILYIIDDINYLGGAHIATKYQINYLLSQGQNISIFTEVPPNWKIRNELLGVRFVSWESIKEDKIYRSRLLFCLLDKNMSRNQKLLKLKLSLSSKFLGKDLFKTEVIPNFARVYSNYDTICVMSEGSKYKEPVALCEAHKKIQWIHIDYCYWRQLNEWNTEITKNDGKLWESFEKIVVLTEKIKSEMSLLYPHLAGKILVFKNIMPVDKIKSLSEIRNKKVRFITVGRVDAQKAYKRLIPILSKLDEEDYDFEWKIIGNGNEYNAIQNMIAEYRLEKKVVMLGAKSNPFRYVKESDVFALMSDFEGLPNTIYEALILGVPVLATNTGGVSEQVIAGETGWLVDNDEKGIYEGIVYVLEHPDEIDKIKAKIKSYKYDNEKIYFDTLNLFTKN